MPVCVKNSHVISLFFFFFFELPPPLRWHKEPNRSFRISSEFFRGTTLQPLIFGFFLSMCLNTVFGNLLIILAVSSDSHLHTPMYFFLSSLSFVDICVTSTTIPKMLWSIQTQSKVITYEACITQVCVCVCVYVCVCVCVCVWHAVCRFG